MPNFVEFIIPPLPETVRAGDPVPCDVDGILALHCEQGNERALQEMLLADPEFQLPVFERAKTLSGFVEITENPTVIPFVTPEE